LADQQLLRLWLRNTPPANIKKPAVSTLQSAPRRLSTSQPLCFGFLVDDIALLCINMSQDPTWTEAEQCVLLYVQMFNPRAQWSHKTDIYNSCTPRQKRTQPSLTAAWRKMRNKTLNDFSSSARQSIADVSDSQSRIRYMVLTLPEHWPNIPLHDRKTGRKDYGRPNDGSTSGRYTVAKAKHTFIEADSICQLYEIHGMLGNDFSSG